MQNSSHLRRVIYLNMFSVLLVAHAARAETEDIIGKLTACDDTFLRNRTFVTELTADSTWGRPPDLGHTKKFTFTWSENTMGWRADRFYSGKPLYREPTPPTSIDYDEDGNLLVWRQTHTEGIVGPDLQARRRETVLLRVNPEGKVVKEEQGWPAVEFREPSDSRKILDFMLPVWSTGRGYANSLVSIIEVDEQENGLISFTARGTFSPTLEGIWTMNVDSKSGYLVRSASFTVNGNPSPLFLCSTTGTKWFGDCSLAEEASCSVGGPDDVTRAKIQTYTPQPDEQLLTELRDSFKAPSRNTRVHEYRGHPIKPLTYRVGKLPVTDRDLLEDIFKYDTKTIPAHTNQPQRTPPKKAAIPGTEPNGLTESAPPAAPSATPGRPILYLVLALTAIGIAIYVGSSIYAKKTSKQ